LSIVIAHNDVIELMLQNSAEATIKKHVFFTVGIKSNKIFLFGIRVLVGHFIIIQPMGGTT